MKHKIISERLKYFILVELKVPQIYANQLYETVNKLYLRHVYGERNRYYH